jgi:hypothetical protein
MRLNTLPFQIQAGPGADDAPVVTAPPRSLPPAIRTLQRQAPAAGVTRREWLGARVRRFFGPLHPGAAAACAAAAFRPPVDPPPSAAPDHATGANADVGESPSANAAAARANAAAARATVTAIVATVTATVPFPPRAAGGAAGSPALAAAFPDPRSAGRILPTKFPPISPNKL